jgi:tungstate transport system ATP-binding protein
MAYSLEEIRHSYGKRTVLDVSRLDVRQGEMLALVGPSGAGKSTLLRLLNFLEPPTQGRIWFHNCLINSHASIPLSLRRSVTMVFQRPIMRSTSVLNNAAYGLQLRKVPGARAAARAALEKLGLLHLAHKSAHTLSSGEMQRVALVRAMLTRPAVLLLDEPTANLDPYNIKLIEEALIEDHGQHGTTMVLVTHNIFQARRLAQRVALLLDGQIIEVADVTSFFESPRDARTRAFLQGDIVY